MSVHSVYQNTLPPETFPSLKISKKSIFGLDSAPDPAGEVTPFPRRPDPGEVKGRERDEKDGMKRMG